MDELTRRYNEQFYAVVSLVPQLGNEPDDFKRVGQLLVDLTKIVPFCEDPNHLKDAFELREKMEALVREIRPGVDLNRGNLKLSQRSETEPE